MNKIHHFCLIIVFLSLFGCGGSDNSAPESSAVFPAFADDFEDGIIDSQNWVSGGQTTEGAGVLALRRETSGDYIETIKTFSGNWRVVMEIRLNSIEWQDVFHGISIVDESGDGISFGFSMYGKLYQGTHFNSGSTQFSYGPTGSNNIGEWQTWTLERIDSQVSVMVDGVAVPGLSPVDVPEKVFISLPGYYSDGNGAAGTGLTSSDVELFSIEELP